MFQNINIWDQNWLKDGMSIPTPPDMQHDAGDVSKVKDLMLTNSKAWNHVIVNNIFDDSNTATKILQTPLFESIHEDIITWKPENNGVYSVRSAYKICVNSAGTQVRHCIAGSWNEIWRAKIPPKVKNLLWRIGRNVLPTRMRLNSRGVHCPTNCSVCNEGDEDTLYVLFFCHKSIQCWQRVGLWDIVSTCLNTNNSVAENIFVILHRLNKDDQELFSVMVWSLWKRRNNQVWENITELNQTVCERAKHLLIGWRNAQQVRSLINTPQPPPQPTRWIKPAYGRYKCNIDASFSLVLNKVGIGMCIRDNQGNFVTAITEWIKPILDVEIGEAFGLLRALKWTDELQLHNTDFEIDCKRVVDSLYSKRTYNSDLGAILNDCRTMLATNFVNSDVKFIRRQANEVAHKLARVALSLASFHIFSDIPTCIYDIIINEMR
jgi:hypothetical protein